MFVLDSLTSKTFSLLFDSSLPKVLSRIFFVDASVKISSVLQPLNLLAGRHGKNNTLEAYYSLHNLLIRSFCYGSLTSCGCSARDRPLVERLELLQRIWLYVLRSRSTLQLLLWTQHDMCSVQRWCICGLLPGRSKLLKYTPNPMRHNSVKRNSISIQPSSQHGPDYQPTYMWSKYMLSSGLHMSERPMFHEQTDFRYIHNIKHFNF